MAKTIPQGEARALRPSRAGFRRNFTTTGVLIAAEGEYVEKLVVMNATASLVWFQVFDVAASEVVLGTTEPIISIPTATNTHEEVTFDPPLYVPRGLTIFGTNDITSGAAGATPHAAQAFITANPGHRGPYGSDR